MYPITYSAAIPAEGRNRLTVLLRYFTAIPILIVAAIYGIGGFFAAIAAWFSIVFTGKYPEGLYDFNTKVLRINSRANSYYLLATDEYPPFDGDEHPEYPIQVGTPAPLAEYDRVKTGLRMLIGIPVYILAIVQSIIATVVTLIAWFVIIFTAKMPEGLIKPLHGALAYLTKAAGYYQLLLTEDYPPFSEDDDVVPAGQISGGTKTKAK
jgi:Domain of unknown function (DUF4389)